MRHFESHGDDDMTGTHSAHQGAKVHMTHNGGHMDESVVNELDEEFGQLDELSKKTLGSYISKAASSKMNLERKKGKNDASDEALRSAQGKSDDYETRAAIEHGRRRLDRENEKIGDKQTSRTYGIRNAVKRLTKEDIEAFFESEEFQSLDELSKTTLGSYVKKAQSNSIDSGYRMGVMKQKSDEIGRFTNRNDGLGDHKLRSDLENKAGASQDHQNKEHKTLRNRMRGVQKAVSRLTK
jgi:hypothetical protein